MCWHNSHKANYRDSTGNKKHVQLKNNKQKHIQRDKEKSHQVIDNINVIIMIIIKMLKGDNLFLNIPTVHFRSLKFIFIILI